jgi:hypothetical protein
MDFKNGMYTILAETCLTGNQGVTLGMRSLISLRSTISFAQVHVCLQESPSNVLFQFPVCLSLLNSSHHLRLLRRREKKEQYTVFAIRVLLCMYL